MEKHPLYGKRKKKRKICPNPLFAHWLQEWKDDAREKGIKSQFIYGKALKSLRNYPLPIATGKDCKMLEYFVISWRSVLLVEKTGVHRENQRPVASHLQTLSHNAVSSTPHFSRIRTHNISGDRY